MATTGSSLDALKAGNNPESRPIITEIKIPDKTLDKLMDKENVVTKLTIKVSIKMSNKPNVPPIMDKITASNKNCNIIKVLRAPSAF